MSAPLENDPLIEPKRMAFLEPVSRLYATNPFEPAWDELLREALRDDYVPVNEAKVSRGDLYGNNPASLTEPLGTSLSVIGDRLAHGVEGTPRELSVYHGAAIYCYLLDERLAVEIHGHALAFGDAGRVRIMHQPPMAGFDDITNGIALCANHHVPCSP